MQTLKREIVGAYIFSVDSKVLLGKNKLGGAYQDQLTIPGGGVEPGETYAQAMCREVQEETGIDLKNADIKAFPEAASGQSIKKDALSGDEVLMQMTFYDFEVRLSQKSDSIKMVFNDDLETASWFTSQELINVNLAPNVDKTLRRLHFLK